MLMSTPSKPPLSVGQTLFLVSSDRVPRKADVQVEKVGRKWAELSNGKRIDVLTWLADGGQYRSPGCCWESRERYEQEAGLKQAWAKLRLDVQNSFTPKDVSVEDIEAARRLLKLG